MVGNEAIAEAAIRAGCQFYAGYPITPQNELIAYMARRMREEKRVFIQAESEIAAINMVLGAAATGARAMTTSSSPGISLKQEGISYLAGAQLPAVIVNVMRGGPGLGNIASSQSDYFQATRGGGHGDYFTLTLSPWSVEEAVRLTSLAFDLADRYRNPVLVLADAIIGQMMEPVSFRLCRERSRPFPAKTKKPWALTGAEKRPPNVVKSFFLREGGLEVHNARLKNKWARIKVREQRFSVYPVRKEFSNGARKASKVRFLAVAYGSQARIVKEAVDSLRNEGVNIGLFRPVTLWPYPKKGLVRAAKEVEKILVIEQSLGQMLEDVQLTLPGKEILFLGKAGGGVPSVTEIVKFVKKNVGAADLRPVQNKL